MKSSKQEDLGDSPKRALGLYKDVNGHYKVVRIDYDPESGATLLVEQQQAGRVPDAAHIAKFNFEELIEDEIFNKLELL